ncbi:MAG: efflux RND transporter periplasmic adaptor subunit [Candidatus Dadabacteria bacterium]|nr:efflux RND transporter periplasmic adaptor subunit [Candidatus Dadabacteria bacterium]
MKLFDNTFAMFGAMSGRLRLAVLAVLALSLWVGMSLREGSTQYVIRTVSVGSVVSTITSVGTLKHFEEIEIHSSIPGTVTEVLKDRSEQVAKDDVLVRLDATALKSRYEKARAEFETAEADFKYQSELYEKRLTSANDYNKARIATEQTRAEFAEAERMLKATEIKSPIEGTVIHRSVEVGRSVDNTGGMLMKVAGSPDRMRLLIRVSEADIGRIAEGQMVLFTVPAFRNQTFTGEILSVPGAPLDDKGAVAYEVMASVENKDHTLKSGMTADVTVRIARVDDVVRVPTSALRFLPSDGSAHASGSAVWVRAVTGELRRIPVAVGESNEIYAEITAGEITEGDKVVVGVVSAGAGEEDSGGMSLPQPKRF